MRSRIVGSIIAWFVSRRTDEITPAVVPAFRTAVQILDGEATTMRYPSDEADVRKSLRCSALFTAA
jgi:hypothetical protein